MPRRRYLMLRNGPSLQSRLLRLASLACIAAGLAVMATSAAAEPGFAGSKDSIARTYTLSTFEVKGRPLAVTASGRRAYADTPLMRARVEESREMGKAMAGYPQEPHVKVDVRMAF